MKALHLLEVLCAAPEGLSLSAISTRTNLPKATIHRLLGTLIQEGFVEQAAGVYRVGVKAFVVGNAFLTHLDLRSRALPYLFDLRNRTGETVQIAVLENLQVVYVERVLSQSPVAYMKSRVGAVLPAYCTGLGKALLAFTPSDLIQHYLDSVSLAPLTPHTITDRRRFLEEVEEIRRLGYAVDRGEREESVRCIAAPIFDHERLAVAAISVAGPAERMPWPLEGSAHADLVVQAARQISSALGCPPQAGAGSL